jgi:hypothetical protein
MLFRPVPAYLRLKVHGGFIAAIHVKGHRLVFVRDLPLAIDLLKTERVSEPEITLRAVDLRSMHPVKTVAKRNVVADRNTQVANLVSDWALPGSKPLFQAFRIETDESSGGAREK